ncbi:programmed cell death protein [Basidiobolus meristosporus CBS 931.73]|uniref:Programmed cell death protein n=1 Tax=Basidiobolus meristosporus CBS 931.73 TaxID=1314790 RepID=A0A1Y1Y382_9FUNG|nr:programmed cell death protein [Basidiobolus meristosporus CBS 931.73]|eukprot:ORX92448.1 programmed cell death protein [Basidiobolus meristosporus CBS 931.73]
MNSSHDDRRLLAWFQSVDRDNSGDITAQELQVALSNGSWTPFNMETVRLMINMFDRDHNGTINYQEFAGLWRYIEDWQKCFLGFDKDHSGYIDAQELQDALRAFGYNLTPQFVRLLILKYDSRGKGDVSFDNFIQICVTIRSLTESFRRFDTDSDGWILINYEQFLELVLSNR